MSAYRSILPQRTRPIEAADFRCASTLSVHAHSFAVPDSLDGELSAWNRTIPFLPKTLLKFYRDTFGTSVNLEVHFLAEYDELSTDDFFSLNVDSPDDSFFGSVKFLEGKKLENEGSSFEVQPSARGNGLGKAWLKSMVELALAMGNGDLKFQASSQNGAYTWGKAGVPMNMAPEQSNKRINLSRMVIGRLEAVRPFLSPSDYDLAKTLARFTAKDDINRLAAMDVIVPPFVLDDLREKDSSVCDRMMEFHTLHPSLTKPKFLVKSEKVLLPAAFEAAAKQGRQLSLPRFLLAFQTWEARIDFSNAGEMQTIGAYLGGWKTIMPTSRDHDPALQL